MRRTTAERIAAEKTEDEKFYLVSKEIFQWRDEHPGTSYYDMEEYAYNNDKEEWIKVLKSKNKRVVFSEYFRSKRRTENVQYTRDRATAMEAALEAKINYQKRHIDAPYPIEPIE